MPTEIQKLLEDLKEYIEDTEVKIEGEWGCCRSLEEIKSDGDMPELYDRVLSALANPNGEPRSPKN